MEETIINELPIDDVIDLLQSTPRELWGTGAYELNGKCCTLGIINKYYGGTASHSRYEMPIRSRVRKFLKERHDIESDVIVVNDTNIVNGYDEEHPQDRVLHLLNDMKEAGYTNLLNY